MSRPARSLPPGTPGPRASSRRQPARCSRAAWSGSRRSFTSSMPSWPWADRAGAEAEEIPVGPERDARCCGRYPDGRGAALAVPGFAAATSGGAAFGGSAGLAQLPESAEAPGDSGRYRARGGWRGPVRRWCVPLARPLRCGPLRHPRRRPGRLAPVQQPAERPPAAEPAVPATRLVARRIRLARPRRIGWQIRIVSDRVRRVVIRGSGARRICHVRYLLIGDLSGGMPQPQLRGAARRAASADPRPPALPKLAGKNEAFTIVR